MSNKMDTELRLPGHEGPFFPPLIRVMNMANCFASFGWNGHDFNIWARRIAGCMPEDDHFFAPGWFNTQSFKVSDAIIRICFPDAMEWKDCSDGTSQKRHVAVYTQGTVSPEALDAFLEEAVRHLYLHIAENIVKGRIYDVLVLAIDQPKPAKAIVEGLKRSFHTQYTIVGDPLGEGNSMGVYGEVTVIIDGKPVTLKETHARMGR